MSTISGPSAERQSVTGLKQESIAVIPCYNTASRCAVVIQNALRYVDAVIAVDDGSTDDTFEHIRSSGCSWLRSSSNEGKGRALQKAFDAILTPADGLIPKNYKYVVTLDGDGQHDPAEIPRLLRMADQQDLDFVLGVRSLSRMPLKSRIGNFFSRGLFRLRFVAPVSDTQTGFRVIRSEVLRKVFDRITWGKYETEMDMLCRVLSDGFRVGAVTIKTIYFDKNRLTHFRPLLDSMKVIAVLLRYTAVGMMAAAVDVFFYAAIVAANPAAYLVANVWSRAVSVGVHFLLTRYLAFRVKTNYKVAETIRYGLVVVVNLCLTIWFVFMFVRWLGIGPVPAKMLAQALAFLASFGLIRRFVYRPDGEAKPDLEQFGGASSGAQHAVPAAGSDD